MEEILHQLIGGKHPIIYRFSTILLVVYRISQPSTVLPYDMPIAHQFLYYHYYYCYLLHFITFITIIMFVIIRYY